MTTEELQQLSLLCWEISYSLWIPLEGDGVQLTPGIGINARKPVLLPTENFQTFSSYWRSFWYLRNIKDNIKTLLTNINYYEKYTSKEGFSELDKKRQEARDEICELELQLSILKDIL
jgi:hypothetical protein